MRERAREGDERSGGGGGGGGRGFFPLVSPLSFAHDPRPFPNLYHHRHHSDIKPENILLVGLDGGGGSSNAASAAPATAGLPPGSTGPVLKLADLGSCRGMLSRQPYTEYISTRWYR